MSNYKKFFGVLVEKIRLWCPQKMAGQTLSDLAEITSSLTLDQKLLPVNSDVSQSLATAL